MSPRALPFATTFAAMFLLLAACASPTEEGETAESTDDELRAFRPNELVGTIAYGETKSVHHPADTTYRAYAFVASRGDRIQATVSADRHDAVAWLVGPSNATLLKVDAAHDARAEVATYTIKTSGRYTIAFREADYEPAQFSVMLARLDAPPPPPPPPPPPVDACTGTARYPITGPIKGKTATRIEYKRTCDAYGVCTAWAESTRRGVPPTSFTISPGRHLRAEIGLSSYTSQQGSSTYVCATKDAGASTVDTNGKAIARMQWSDQCNIQGGSGGPYDIGPYRPADFTVGDRCASIIDQDPPAASNFGVQTKIAYFATFD